MRARVVCSALRRPIKATRRWSSNTSAVSAAPVPCRWYDLGVVGYTEAWRWQQDMLRSRIEGNASGSELLPDVVFFLQHHNVYTLGRAANKAHLLFDPSEGSVDAEVHTVERGGKVTYHGPGQLVVYPILNLARFTKDLHWYVRSIEEVIIATLGHFGIIADRAQGFPGVWVGDRKVAQVGMNCSKWVTTHGFAINVDPDMRYFGHIVPCGIDDRPVTSMAQELQRRVSVDEVKPVVARHFQRLFNAQLVPTQGDPLENDRAILKESGRFQ